MRTMARYFSLLAAVGVLLILLAAPASVRGQEAVGEEAPETAVGRAAPDVPAGPETAPPGIVFVEIRLSEDRAVATDTSGREWVYSFAADLWVEGMPGLEGGAPVDRGQPRDEVPVDLRATRKVEVRPFEGSVTIGYDEYVDGDILATGRVTIKGWVKGDVRSINRRVLVAETGRVDGDVEAPSVIVRPGGVVGGTVRESGGPLDVGSLTRAISVDAIVVVTALAFLLAFFGFLVLAVLPRHSGRIGECIAHHPVRTYALGMLFILLMPVVIVLFTITVVGILLVPFVPLVYLAGMGMGFVAFGGMLGGWLLRRTMGVSSGVQLRTALGMLLVAFLWLGVILLLGAGSSFLLGLGYALLVVAIAATSFPICTGIGGAVLTRFGTRDYVSWRERRPANGVPPAPAPPPLHEPPPVIMPWPVAPPDRPERGERPEDRPPQH